jgi:O-antigen/teichoic acid export membrane protein
MDKNMTFEEKLNFFLNNKMTLKNGNITSGIVIGFFISIFYTLIEFFDEPANGKVIVFIVFMFIVSSFFSSIINIFSEGKTGKSIVIRITTFWTLLILVIGMLAEINIPTEDETLGDFLYMVVFDSILFIFIHLIVYFNRSTPLEKIAAQEQ